jgi:hypothetical protein
MHADHASQLTKSRHRLARCALAVAIAAGAVGAAAAPAGATTYTKTTNPAGRTSLTVDTDDTQHNIQIDVRPYPSYDAGSQHYFVLFLRDTGGDDVKESKVLDGWFGAPGESCDKYGECPLPPEGQRVRLILRLGSSADRARITWQARDALYRPEIWGGAGNDTLWAEGHSARTPAFEIGGGGDDSLFGSRTSSEALFGGPGNDRITPGDGAADYVDGGEGVFDQHGRPAFRNYVDNPKECAARTQGFWDRASDAPSIGPRRMGIDTLDLSLPNAQGADPLYGAQAELNICRLTFSTGAYVTGPYGRGPGLVHAIEVVRGTPFNDRLAGDGTGNVLTGNAGRDWLSAGRGGSVDARDGEPDTVQCLGAGSYNVNLVDKFDMKLLAQPGKPCSDWRVG